MTAARRGRARFLVAGLLGCVLVGGGLAGCGTTGDAPRPGDAPTASSGGSAAAVRVDVSAAPGVEATVVERVRGDVGDAVRHVRTVWDGPWSSDVDVYIVPDGAAVAEAADGLAVGAGQLDSVAAVAVVPTVERTGDASPQASATPSPGSATDEVLSGAPRGRLVVNADIYRQLSDVGRVVVTRHEMTHLASASATPPDLPVWLVEGFADAVARTGLSDDARTGAPELAAEVTAGRLPSELPADEAFAGADGRLAQTYQEAWLACKLVVERAGIAGLVRLYREAGTGATSDSSPGQAADSAARLDAALVDVLGFGHEAFTTAWRDYLVRDLAAPGSR